MAQNYSAPLRFQLNESVWLDHHARSAEITSLSLEPVVEIEEDRGFVTIKGYLELIGRFETEEEGGDTSLDLESSSLAEQLQYEPFRVEQKEIYQKEYKGKIEQRFPVDITLPVDKVKNVNEVYINVEEFDYSISDQHRLSIEANIEVSGILTESNKDLILSKKGQDFRAESVYPEFDVTAHREEIEKEEELRDEADRSDHDSDEENSSEQFDHASAEEADRVYAETNAEEHQSHDLTEEGSRARLDETSAESTSADDIQSFDYLGNLTRKPAEEELKIDWDQVVEDNPYRVQDIEEVKESPLNMHEGEALSQEEAPEHAEYMDSEIKTTFHSAPSKERDTEAQEEGVSEPQTSEESMPSFLTQLMSSKANEGNEVTRLRMCIIQKNESLEDIAQRYELRVTEIMRYNKLETQEIRTGQILYIPKH